LSSFYTLPALNRDIFKRRRRS